MPDKNLNADIIYICSPNNPTGAAYTREQLKVWVDFALNHNSLILFDAAYECFIEDDIYPHSIFEIEGAKKCAIEFCSLSKTAGFTGTRCGYTIVPLDLIVTCIKRTKDVCQLNVDKKTDYQVQWRSVYCTVRCSCYTQ